MGLSGPIIHIYIYIGCIQIYVHIFYVCICKYVCINQYIVVNGDEDHHDYQTRFKAMRLGRVPERGPYLSNMSTAWLLHYPATR